MKPSPTICVATWVLLATTTCATRSHLRRNGIPQEQRRTNTATSDAAIPFSDKGCSLAAPLSLDTGCNGASPIDLSTVTECSSIAGSNPTPAPTGTKKGSKAPPQAKRRPILHQNEPCFQTDPATGVGTVYTSTLKTNKQKSSLIDAVASAEGSYCGFSASLSASYLSTSQMSSNSYSFVIGQSQVFYTRKLANYEHLTLTPGAKALLVKDPELFLDMYGNHFVYSISHGGSFIGSTNVYSSDTSSSQSLKAFVGLKADESFFTASGSAKFSTAVKNSGSSLQISSTATWTGASRTEAFNASNPMAMGTFFQDTWGSMQKDTAAPMKMNYIDWISIREVADQIASTGNRTLMELFRPHSVTSTTSNQLAVELSQLQNLRKSVEQTQQWLCYKMDKQETIVSGSNSSAGGSFSQSIDKLYAKVTAKIEQIQQMKEQEMLMVQLQMTKGDLSFFSSGDLEAEYRAIVDSNQNCQPLCPGHLWTLPQEDRACGGNYDTYSCHRDSKNGAAPMNGIDFGPTCQPGIDTQAISVSCMDASVFHSSISGNSTIQNTRTTPNKGCTDNTGTCKADYGTFTSHMCPAGYYVTGIRFTHQCGTSGIDNRAVSLECVKPNNAATFALSGSPYVTSWKGNTCQTTAKHNNELMCQQPGDVLLGIDFTHVVGHNQADQEQVRLHCQALTGSQLYCPSTSMVGP